MEIIIYIVSGFLAGIVTGLVGLSAATVIGPMFATFLGMNTYVAIGIALFSDVFASATSALNYYSHKNIDLKKGAVFGAIVVFFTIIGSYFSKDTDPTSLNSIINFIVIFLGLRFIIFPVKERQIPMLDNKHLLFAQIIFWGVLIGLINGVFGAGGGLSILAVLTILLGYDLKTGVGTSVFIMIFTALVGSVTHFIIGGTLLLPLLITGFSAFVGANLSSKFANKVNEVVLNRVVGIVLICLGIILTGYFYLGI